jgi:phosphatidate cytidylyltransferase
MLRTRLWMGALFVALVVAMLVVDQPPWYPFLLLLVLVFSLAGCAEMVYLLPPERRPPPALAYAAVGLVTAANWLAHVPQAPELAGPGPWFWIAAALAAVVLGAFLAEMATFREPGDSVARIALTVWLAVYLGLLPGYFTQLRWLWGAGSNRAADLAATALALAVFVPKGTDIGAYFTGRMLGRHRIAPVLSPKKTWEGAVGGLGTAVLITVLIDRFGPAAPLAEHLGAETGFGLSVGVAGMLGDLAESLIKRDCRQKDASHVVPGFGGVLDVVDAILFAAPVAYAWFVLVNA